MGTNKILLSGLVGGIVAFIVGYLIWGLALAGYMDANAGTATGVDKEPMVFWAIGLGTLADGMLLAVIFGRWTSIKTPKSGMIAGAVIGLLLGISMGFGMYGTTNIATMPLTIVNCLASAVYYAITGGAVGFMLGRSVPALEKAAA